MSLAPDSFFRGVAERSYCSPALPLRSISKLQNADKLARFSLLVSQTETPQLIFRFGKPVSTESALPRRANRNCKHSPPHP